MIQSNELRSGNLIIGTYENEDDNLMHETICTFKFYNCYDNYYNVESKDGIEEFTSFKPIPLTEEILLKCGFYYSDDDDEFLEYKVFKSFKFHADYSDKFSCISYRINDTTNEIKFLHQLQNLYWCLCGEELTFNNL